MCVDAATLRHENARTRRLQRRSAVANIQEKQKIMLIKWHLLENYNSGGALVVRPIAIPHLAHRARARSRTILALTLRCALLSAGA